MAKAFRGLPSVIAALLAISVLFVAYTAQTAFGQGGAANKIAVSGSDVDETTDDTVLISEEMKVSNPKDLILGVTAECSILTELTTGGTSESGASDSAYAFGSVRLQVLIDGIPVPVAATEGEGGDDTADDDDEVGEVTFCNRTYSRTVTDHEDDGLDEEDDYIDTRTANAFNWIALNAGDNYDVNDDNILTIEVLGDFDTDTAGDAVADAFVGSRTLTVEVGSFQNGETVGGTDGTSNSGK